MVNHIMTSNKKQILFISKRGKMHNSAVFSAVATGFAVCLRQKGVEFFFWVCYNVGNQSQGSYIGNTTASQAVKAGATPVSCSKTNSHRKFCGSSIFRKIQCFQRFFVFWLSKILEAFSIYSLSVADFRMFSATNSATPIDTPFLL